MQKTLFSLVALIWSTGLVAQQFQQVFSTPSVDTFTSVANAPDNGFILGGFSSGVGSGSNDAFFIRTNQFGDTLWNATFGGEMNESLDAIIQKSNGNYLFTGSSQSWNPLGNTDTFIGEFTPEGELNWSIGLNGINQDLPYAMELTDDDGFLITGITNSFSPEGSFDIFALKGTSEGEIEWYKVYGGPEYEAPRGITSDSDGNVYIWGHHSTSTSLGYDPILLKLDSEGELLFTKSYGLSANEIASDIIIAANGDLLMTSDTNSEGQGFNDILLIRMTNEGEIIFAKTIGAGSSDHSLDITHVENNMYAIIGATASFGAGGLDYMVTYVTEHGDVKYTFSFGGDEKDVAFDAVKTEDDGLVLVGTTRSFGEGFGSAYAVRLDNSFKCGCNGFYDGQFMAAEVELNIGNVGLELRAEGIVSEELTFPFNLGNATNFETLCSDAPIENGFTEQESNNTYEQESTTRLKVTPNPSNGPVTVSVKSLENTHTRLEVFSLEGRLLQEYLVGLPGQSSQSSIVLRPLPTGIYLVRMTSGGKLETKRFVIN